MQSQKLVLALGLLLAGTAIAFAQDMRPPINADDVKWGPVPPNIAAGAQLAVISGDPSKEGPFVMRLKMPAGYKVPAHYHPQYENVTVLTGEFHVGMGDKLDTDKGMLLRPGGYVEAPAKMHHYAWVTSDTIVQVAGPGPFGIIYVDPADDPSKK
jgi:quercetin dioxygenase-like cupin family protein